MDLIEYRFDPAAEIAADHESAAELHELFADHLSVFGDRAAVNGRSQEASNLRKGSTLHRRLAGWHHKRAKE